MENGINQQIKDMDEEFNPGTMVQDMRVTGKMIKQIFEEN